jgi:hypothetical protein
MVREEIVFGDDECLRMRAYVEHRGWIHNKRRIKLAQPNVERAVRAHGNLVLRKVILLSKEQKVASDSQTRISEPDRRTNEQGVDDADEDDINSDATLIE